MIYRTSEQPWAMRVVFIKIASFGGLNLFPLRAAHLECSGILQPWMILLGGQLKVYRAWAAESVPARAL
jgi:hypothetical protein